MNALLTNTVYSISFYLSDEQAKAEHTAYLSQPRRILSLQHRSKPKNMRPI